MTENIKTENNMSSSCLTRRSRNKDLRADWIPDQVGDDRGMGVSMTSARGESGRSMVEMLGTLAIIGVLSVGGIAGYTYAMNKHYANELLAGASERAVLVTAQIASGRKPSLKEFANHPNVGGEFDNDEIVEFTDGFGIKVSKVKEAVCENILNAIESTDIGIAKEDGTMFSDGDCADGTFVLTFANDMAGGDVGPIVCKSKTIKIYNCETSETIDCCPDKQTCEPTTTCSCDSSSQDTPSGLGLECENDELKCIDGGYIVSNFEYGLGCCKDGYLYAYNPDADEYGYTAFSAECPEGCPEGYTADIDGIHCCKDGMIYMPDGGIYQSAYSCGCPEGETLISIEEGYSACCKGNIFHEANTYYISPYYCGCPDGVQTADHYCCKDGWDVNYSEESETLTYSLNPEICGCPDGDPVEGKYSRWVCCKDGLGVGYDNEGKLIYENDPDCLGH